MRLSGTSRPSSLQVASAAAPALLLLYGLLRLADGRDGEHGPGLAWDLGHTFFFLAFVLFGVLIVGLRRSLQEPGTGRRAVASAAAGAGLFGVVGFLWVILCDLFEGLDERASLPDPLYAACPLLFQLGLLTLLARLVAARRLPLWSPLLVFLGFVPIAVNLDLLPVGALLIGAGLSPFLARPAVPGRPVAAR